MNPFAIAVMLVALGSAAAAAGADDLIDAAKDAKEKRRRSTAKVLTNADVKKSKSKLGTNNPASKAAPAIPVSAEPTSLEKHQATRAAAALNASQLAAAEGLVTELEKELAAVEQRYYEENDLDRRDGELVKRFNAVKAKLDAARAAVVALTPKPQGESGPVVETQ
jgi:hypothetical protein